MFEQSRSQYNLISVRATSLTSGELFWPEPNSLEFPIPGFDMAGVVISPASRSEFKTGDEVYALTSFSRAGAAREQQIALDAELALKPKSLSWEEAATVPLSALTASQALFVYAGLSALPQDNEKDGEKKRVLVTAASGGVGVWAVQFASRAGAFVVATCGPSNIDFVKELGAHEVLDYTNTNLSQWVQEDDSRRFDIVIDCKGGDTLAEAWTVVKPSGFLNSVAQPAETKKPATGVAEGVRTHWFIVDPDGGQLELVSNLIESGKCKAIVDSIWSLDDWREAFQRLDSGHARGKVVLKVSD
ncbi:NAD(P)-binding protein [Rhizodiscina lignyota]|uniref:NAD(P)-binding protein n=1 Tax=Rhizodiscina lignyota TaxID=1504668 RepID=A0A9P4M3E3_9PEZI|nr:NAD(P)-binding protein [Rhizodiscina lignyota]